MKIQDGTGSGVFAQVDDKHRVLVDSVSTNKLQNKSKDGAKSYIVSTGALTVTSTAEHSILYIYNGTDKEFSFAHFWLSYNGGSTTWNKTSTFKFKGGVSSPSANNTAWAAGNLNTGSANQSGLTIYVWNGTSTGMTHATAGDVAGSSLIAKGTSDFDFPGFILAPGKSCSFSVTCEEIGIVAITATGYFD